MSKAEWVGKAGVPCKHLDAKKVCWCNLLHRHVGSAEVFECRGLSSGCMFGGKYEPKEKEN